MRRLHCVLLALALGCRGPLEGQPASGSVSDWRSVADASDFSLATQSGRRFRTVRTDVFAQGDALYLHVSTIFPLADGALDELLEGGLLQIRADGRLHTLRAAQLETAAELDPLLPLILRDQMKVEATGARWDPDPARYPGTQIRQWWFRLDPTSGS